jgi:Trypsin
VLTVWLDRREREAVAYLIEENRFLRRQLGTRRLRLTDDDHRRLAARAYRGTVRPARDRHDRDAGHVAALASAADCAAMDQLARFFFEALKFRRRFCAYPVEHASPRGSSSSSHVAGREPKESAMKSHRRASVRIALLTALAVVAIGEIQGTHAIINGTLDGNLHPNVGMVVAEANGVKFTPCSGILVAPQVFVGAAHCLEFIASRGATQAWVTFDSQVNLDSSPLIPATLHPNPAYDANAPDPNDVAVITLATPVEGIVYGELPTPGLLDGVGAGQLFTVVGYGANERIVGDGPVTFLRDRARRFATSELNALRPAELRLSMNPSRGYGGASFGDSGGPIFLGQSTTVAAIVGLRGSNGGTYEGYRLDIPSARAFLASFVTLPD